MAIKEYCVCLLQKERSSSYMEKRGQIRPGVVQKWRHQLLGGQEGQELSNIWWCMIVKYLNTTSDIQNIIVWHSTFCQFLNIFKRFYWLSQKMQARFVVFKLFCYSNLGGFCQNMECHKVIFWYHWWSSTYTLVKKNVATWWREG